MNCKSCRKEMSSQYDTQSEEIYWQCDNCEQPTENICIYNGSAGSKELKGKELCDNCMEQIPDINNPDVY